MCIHSLNHLKHDYLFYNFNRHNFKEPFFHILNFILLREMIFFFLKISVKIEFVLSTYLNFINNLKK